jgi:hypothetical protein
MPNSSMLFSALTSHRALNFPLDGLLGHQPFGSGIQLFQTFGLGNQLFQSLGSAISLSSLCHGSEMD